MNIITHIKNCIFLFRYSYKKQIPEKADAEAILKVTKHFYTRKNSWVRNQVARLIRNIRKVKPYQIIDYSKARELYENTIPIDLSKVKANSYVYKISREEPVKGKLWCEYYTNHCGEEGIFKVQYYEKSYDYWRLLKYNGDSNNCGLDESRSRAYRFATKEEIEKFKIAQKNYKQKKKEIEFLQERISKLHKEL